MTTDVDLIVAGGGPVGLAAAIHARLSGLTVAVIEPRANAIDKACGEGLMPGALPLLAELGVDPPGMPLLGVSYRNATTHVDHVFRTGAGRGVRRLALHDALTARAAELGADRIVGKVTRVYQDATGVTVGDLRASWLFGCDGLHSTVRGLAGLERASKSRSRRYGLRQHFEVKPWSELIEVHWSSHVEAYVTPVSENVVGIALLGGQKIDFRAELRALPELENRVSGAKPTSSLRGAGPLRQRATRPSSGRVLLLGDASGYVDALTGEGLRLGFDQAKSAVASIVANDPRRYDHEWQRITRDFRVLTTGLVDAARSPLRNAVVPLARALPGVFGAVVERLAR